MMEKRGEGGRTRVGDSLAGLLPKVLPAGLFDEVIKPSDVGYPSIPSFFNTSFPRATAKETGNAGKPIVDAPAW